MISQLQTLVRFLLLPLFSIQAIGPVICPEGGALCMWHEDAGWRKIWTIQDRTPVLGISIVKGGRIVVSAEGHNYPGYVHVLDKNGGSIIVLRRNYTHDLAKISGVTPEGDLILCPSARACDVWIPAMGNQENASVDFPEGCLFPRFRSNSAGLCVHNQVILGQEEVGGEFDEIGRVPDSHEVQDLRILGDQLWILVDGALHTVEAISGQATITDVVKLWIVEDAMFAQTQSFDEDLDRLEFGISRVSSNALTEQVWSSPSRVPHIVFQTPDGVVLDAWGREGRGLYRLRSGQRKFEVFWEQPGPGP